MFPNLFVRNHADGSDANPKLCRNIIEGFTFLASLKNRTRNFFGNFTSPVLGALLTFLPKDSVRMEGILSSRDIFQVVEGVPVYHAALVVNLHSLWPRPYKRLHDKMVDLSSVVHIVSAQRYAGIAFGDVGEQNLSDRFPDHRDAPHSAKITDFVETFIARYRFPVFHIRHSTSFQLAVAIG